MGSGRCRLGSSSGQASATSPWGCTRQGFDLQLTQYDERGWRATFYTTGMEHSRTSATDTAWERAHERDELIPTAIRYPSGTSAACCQGDSLDTQLFLRDGGAAGVARLSFARSTEDSRDAITRKTAVLELVRDEDVKKVS